MRLSAFPLVLAGAGLAVQQVVASPLRVVVVTSHQEISNNAQVGSDAASVATFVRPEMIMPFSHHMAEASAGRGRKPCKSMKAKAIALSNKFRVTFGFAPIEIEEPKVNVFTPGFRTGPVLHPGLTVDKVLEAEHGGADHPIQAKGRFRHVHHRLHGSFLHRVHHALMALGPWEGRAVAFVLGCGLGVLLRMVWVMTLISYRLIRGGNAARDTEGDITQGDMYYEGVVLFETDAEESLPAPPQYVDEKVVLAAADKAAAAEN